MSPKVPYVWIEDKHGLLRAVERLARAKSIAVDTEADSFYHYFHKCCLIQISSGRTSYLIDPLAFENLDPLGELFSNTRIVKVLHAAEQDVLYLKRDYGFTLSPLFDTMIAAQLLGRPSVGLAGLLQNHFDVRLDKGCQRDDWSRRPLTERQKEYAAADVRYLPRLRELLEEDLVAHDRQEWAREEFAQVVSRTWEQRGFDPGEFWGIKGARDLTSRQAAILRALYVMRDTRAREADLPPFRIVSDQALLALAQRAPQRNSEMEGIKGFTPLVRRRIGTPVLDAVREGMTVPEAELPKPPKGRGRRRTAISSSRLERLRAWRKAKAAELKLDPGVLFPQSMLEAIAAAGARALGKSDGVPGLREWRRRLILPDAEALLA
ncbi:MAG: HRDC domain-containing protein [Acidobacteria bacterium]|nr:HRDC domain-containing protein [Acidobacteriota bacterium]